MVARRYQESSQTSFSPDRTIKAMRPAKKGNFRAALTRLREDRFQANFSLYLNGDADDEYSSSSPSPASQQATPPPSVPSSPNAITANAIDLGTKTPDWNNWQSESPLRSIPSSQTNPSAETTTDLDIDSGIELDDQPTYTIFDHLGRPREVWLAPEWPSAHEPKTPPRSPFSIERLCDHSETYHGFNLRDLRDSRYYGRPESPTLASQLDKLEKWIENQPFYEIDTRREDRPELYVGEFAPDITRWSRGSSPASSVRGLAESNVQESTYFGDHEMTDWSPGEATESSSHEALTPDSNDLSEPVSYGSGESSVVGIDEDAFEEDSDISEEGQETAQVTWWTNLGLGNVNDDNDDNEEEDEEDLDEDVEMLWGQYESLSE
ncbi:hypothetical protein BT63DRAFT_413552 [Microthyrium microscopicum]|uniref:Uncharacterized protein n=1 Tax=Microthyrium microscopicum TaxID=703497 RepID=A0A6A6UA02_9PEZI|nr:hypothetical protein BT63DRAFT_413552 [Microthyrium microscopicum]